MLVEFGTSRLASHGLYLGNSKQQFFCLTTDFIGFLQRDAGQRTDVDGKRTFVEGRQEAVSQSKERSQCNHKQSDGTS